MLQTFEGCLTFYTVTPGVCNAADGRKVAYLLLRIGSEIVVLATVGWHEDIDADLPLRLATVADEIADAVILVDGVHIVVGLRVEGHTQVLWLHETAVVGVVTGKEDVVAANALRTLAREVEGDAICQYEGIGGFADAIADTLKDHRTAPFVA